ncbi:hypothetical protein FOH38_11165 [Lysinibacillus fusiformis]|nr:hypothetical protein FOH38_11165 [Lysinibacillus fusiformis]
MEYSKLYSTQEIEKLKQKIDSYRETLTSLKMGTSIEDFLFMKNEFDGLKTQIAHLEGLTETLDDKQNSHIKGYEDRINILSTQIESLNQTIEEMNQEIFMVINRLLTIEVNEAPTTLPDIEETPNTIANTSQGHPRIIQTTEQSTITSKQPSYKLLQSLAGKATNMQLNSNNGIPSAHNDIQENKPEERHFNQQYFQSINTHPSQIYNGLYRNTTVESTFHFKKATDAQEIPVSVYDPNTVSPAPNNESVDHIALNSSIVNEPVNDIDVESETINDPVDYVDSKKVVEPDNHGISQKVNEPVDHNHVNAENMNEPGNPVNAEKLNNSVNPVNAERVHEPGKDIHTEMLNEPVYSFNSSITATDELEIFETKSEEVDEPHIPLEEINKQPELIKESTVEENKKEKNSFFNFFKKWS